MLCGPAERGTIKIALVWGMEVEVLHGLGFFCPKTNSSVSQGQFTENFAAGNTQVFIFEITVIEYS